MIDQPPLATVEANLDSLMKVVRDAWERDLAAKTSPKDQETVLEGAPLGKALMTLDRDLSIAVAEALSEVLYECRGAMDYAEENTPAHRLARRVVQALTMSMACRREANEAFEEHGDD